MSDRTVQLSEIGQIAITVSDLKRAQSFYQEKLGMQLLFGAGTMVFFQCGAIRLMIGASENSVASAGTILYFKVKDIQTVHEVLKKEGVEFVDEPHLVARMPDHDLWMVFLKDPDGNTLALMSEVGRTGRA